jgi:hypothetical protein
MDQRVCGSSFRILSVPPLALGREILFQQQVPHLRRAVEYWEELEKQAPAHV